MEQKDGSLLAVRLRLLRRAARMTQEDVSSMLDVTRSAYTYYERDRSKPDFDTLIALAKILGVSIDYLVGLSNLPERRREETQAADGISDEDMISEQMPGQLNREERHLFCLFRLLPEDKQEEILHDLQQKVNT